MQIRESEQSSRVGIRHSTAILAQMADDGELQDLVGLALLARAVPFEPPGRRRHANRQDGDSGVAGGDGQADLALHDPELHDLMMVVAAAAPPGQDPRSFEQRSSQLMAHARECRKEKRAAAKLDEERAKRIRAEQGLQLLALHAPASARQLGIPRQKVQMSEALVLTHVRLACAPRVKGTTACRSSQTQRRVTTMVSDCLLAQQKGFIEMTSMRLTPPAAPGMPQVVGQCIGFCAQWDETSQRLAAIARGLPQAVRQSKCQSGVQVMVISGKFVHCLGAKPRGGGPVSVECTVSPWHARSLRLDKTTADFLLEGLLRRIPLPLTDYEAMRKLTSGSQVVVVSLAADRASSNLSLTKWLFYYIGEVLGIPSVVGHLHPCALHGVALVKGRSKVTKHLIAALKSLTLWLRRQSNMQAFAEALFIVIRGRVRVFCGPRPEAHDHKVHECFEMLYGKDSGESYLQVWSKRQHRFLKSGLALDLDELRKVVCFGEGVGQYFLYYRGDGNGATQGGDVGNLGGIIDASGDDDFKRIVDEVATPVLDMFVSRGWVACCESRWTHVGTTLRRVVLGMVLGGNIFTDALVEVMSKSKLDDSLEESLAKVIAADSSNFAVKKQLRLIRIVRTLRQPGVPAELGAMLVSMIPMDKLMYGIMGHNRSRAKLIDLLHPSRSIIVRCQAQLFELSQHFVGDGLPWAMLDYLGVHRRGADIKKLARRHILQLSGGILNVFELLYCNPPYSLAWVCFEDVPVQVRDAVIQEVYDMPMACVGFMTARLRQRFDTPLSFRFGAKLAMQTWLETTEVAIYLAERSHQQMRSDLRSGGPAAEFTASCDRMVVRQFAADHVALGGLDPGSPLSPLVDAAAPERKEKTARGNGWVEFHAARAKTFKELVAPLRPMTVEERRHMEEHISKEWAELGQRGEHFLWRAMHQARDRRPTPPGVPQAQASSSSSSAAGPSPGGGSIVGAGDKPFVGLWGKSQDPQHLIPPELLVAWETEQVKHVRKEQPQRKAQDHIHDPVPARVQEIQEGWGSLYCCGAYKLNICRRHGARPSFKDELDSITGMLKSWVDCMTPASRDAADRLLMFRAEGGRGISVFSLLVFCHGSPKMQVFAVCALEVVGEQAQRSFPLPAYPFKISLQDRVCRGVREPHGCRSLALETSDELAKYLLTLGAPAPDWKFFDMRYEMPSDDDGLLTMGVLGVEAEFTKPALVRVAKKVHYGIPEELFVEDPLAAGQAEALGKQPQSAGPSGGLPASSGRGGNAADDVAESDSEG